MAKLIKRVFIGMVAWGIASLWVLCGALIAMVLGFDDLWPVIAKTGAAMLVVMLCLIVSLGAWIVIDDL